VIHLDTSFLIRAGSPSTVEARRFRTWLDRGETVRISAVAWAEFLCGPVTPLAMENAAELLGEPEALTGRDATLAAHLFNRSGRRRGSLTDCLVASIAMSADASLATSNVADFRRFEPFGLALAGI
jgi:predicted nucleic acid-binding protein